MRGCSTIIISACPHDSDLGWRVSYKSDKIVPCDALAVYSHKLMSRADSQAAFSAITNDNTADGKAPNSTACFFIAQWSVCSAGLLAYLCSIFFVQFRQNGGDYDEFYFSVSHTAVLCLVISSLYTIVSC